MFRARFFDQQQELTDPKYTFAFLAENGNLNAIKDRWVELNANEKADYLNHLDDHHFGKILQNDNYEEMMNWLMQQFGQERFNNALFNWTAIPTFRNLMRDHKFAAARWLHQHCPDPEMTIRMFMFGDANSLYYASYYGDKDMVDYILQHVSPEETGRLFVSRPFGQSAYTGNLAFVRHMYDLTVAYDEWFIVDENGDVDARTRNVILSMVGQNFKSALHQENSEEAILDIWDWHAEKLSESNIQDMLSQESMNGPGLFGTALDLGKHGCAKWIYTHVSEEQRKKLDVYLTKPQYAALKVEFQEAVQNEVFKFVFRFL